MCIHRVTLTSVRAEPILEAESSGRELIAATAVSAVDEAHHLAGTVPVIVLERASQWSGRFAHRT